jgi:hypothetical protein
VITELPVENLQAQISEASQISTKSDIGRHLYKNRMVDIGRQAVYCKFTVGDRG